MLSSGKKKIPPLTTDLMNVEASEEDESEEEILENLKAEYEAKESFVKGWLL